MSKLKTSINKAITVTDDGQPHVVNMPELKRALILIADNISLLTIGMNALEENLNKRTRYDEWIESQIGKD